MRHARLFPLHVSLAGAMLLLSALPAHAEPAPNNQTAAGVYISHGEKKDPYMSVSLGADGTATVMEDPGNSPMTLFGHWAQSANQVTVTFDPVDGKPAQPPTMVFEANHDDLRVVTWDHAAWGQATPPSMKKGIKVKEMYWSTTVR